MTAKAAKMDAVDQDDPLRHEVFEPVLRPERLRRTISARDIERAGGLSCEEVLAQIRAYGLSVSDPDEPWFTEEEAKVYIELAQLSSIWPRAAYMRVARIYGQALASIAHAEVQAFLTQVNEQLGDDVSEERLSALRDAMEELLPLADPIVAGVHRRWIEHELAQATVHAAEEDEQRGSILGAAHVALLFVDIKNFTAYVDTAGDSAGIAAIEQFDKVVVDEQGQTGHVVKALGDGFMLAYPTGVDAVAAGHRMIHRMPRELGPALHASVHEGLALHRGGDYFGRTVNLAARLLGLSGSGEMLATGIVAASTDARFEWEPRVTTQIRGIREPVEIFRLVGPR